MIATDIVVIGTGFAGLGTAIKLRESGRDDVVVLEKADDVGGTWRDNTYPGCACDVPSHMYSLSYHLNPDWSRHFSEQPEILAYLRRVVEIEGLRDIIRFGTEVTGLTWDADSQRWTVHVAAGEDYSARVVVSGTGALHVPNVLDLPGAERFTGTRFHSARWDHDLDLRDRRVAVIGTGASAVQFIPFVAEEAAAVTVFQRSAPWVLPKHDGPIPAWRRRLFARVPLVQRVFRNALYWLLESRAVGFNGYLNFLPLFERVVTRALRRTIDDPALRDALTPDYRLGCKRILQSNTYYQTFLRDHVRLVTGAVAAVTETGVVDETGVEHPADVIIDGTGFHVVSAYDFLDITGRDGRDLATQFRADGVEGYLGTLVHGFPNLFLMLGPNTGLGHNSVVFMIEQQTRFVVRMLDAMDARGAGSVEVRREAQDRFNADIQRQVERGIWTQGGCTSWYLDSRGRNRTIWPAFTFQYWWRTRTSDLAHLRFTPARTPVRAS